MPSIVDEYLRKAHEAHVAELETHDPFLRRGRMRSSLVIGMSWPIRVEREEKHRVSNSSRKFSGHSRPMF